MIPEYKLTLLIAGMNPGSIRAIENVRELCDSCLDGNYELEVVDIYQEREMVRKLDVIAVPVLIRMRPEPEKRIIGDMLDKREIINALDIPGRDHLQQ